MKILINNNSYPQVDDRTHYRRVTVTLCAPAPQRPQHRYTNNYTESTMQRKLKLSRNSLGSGAIGRDFLKFQKQIKPNFTFFTKEASNYNFIKKLINTTVIQTSQPSHYMNLLYIKLWAINRLEILTHTLF